MKTRLLGYLPEARGDVISKEVDGELLVYDRVRDEAHCLNQTAAAVWKLCDGRTTPSEIAEKLSGNAQTPNSTLQGQVNPFAKRLDNDIRNPGHPEPVRNASIDEGLVWLALVDLRRTHLLEEPKPDHPLTHPILAMPRREAIRRISLGAAIALPIVASMTVPTAVQAAVSCKPPCVPCTSGECCSGVCGPAGNVGCPGTGNKCA
jgi:hypothetical protein